MYKFKERIDLPRHTQYAMNFLKEGKRGNPIDVSSFKTIKEEYIKERIYGDEIIDPNDP
jgi:hypothetical protein